MKKKLVTIILAGALTVSSASTALAGWEQTGTTWKYLNTDNTYMTNMWAWIDGNDGVAECYYFGAEGIMLANCTTPDGYTVNENGAWVVDGVVQTKLVSTPQESQPQNNETSAQTIWGGDGSTSGGGGPVEYEPEVGVGDWNAPEMNIH